MTGDAVLLAGRVAIVTGAGRGIGRAIALAYARAGATVIGTAARSGDELERVAGEAGACFDPVRADVTDARDVDALVGRALEHSGRIDVLVNNAARGMRFISERFFTDPPPFWEADPERWRLVIDTNINGVFLLTRAVVPRMLEAGGGHVINVTINHATMTRAGFSPYGPSKAALEAMTAVWAAELAGTAVRINMLAPGGATATGMIPDGVPAAARESLLDPEIVVPAALRLATDDSHGERLVGTELEAAVRRRR